MSKKIIIVGGVAGGASAAARLRRLDETAEIIMFERDEYISFANCGLPYYIGENIKDRSKLLVQTPEAMKARFAIDVRINSEVTAIDFEQKKVTIRSKEKGIYFETYDYMVLSPGARALRPDIPGINSKKIFTLRNIPDTDQIKKYVDTKGISSAVVIGGGFVGIEIAENLRERGMAVTLVEAAPHILAPLDYDMAVIPEKEMSENKVNILLGDGVKAFSEKEQQIEVTLSSDKKITADMVVLAIGVAPDTKFLQESGMELGPKGHIPVNEKMETSKPGVYAVGDATEIIDFITKTKTAVPLAGPANKQGRIAADNIAGLDSHFMGAQGTSIIKVFGLTVATTGANERNLKRSGIPCKAIIIHPAAHATYYPGSVPMTLKLIFNEEGKILGAQGAGYDGVDKRIDIIATVIRMNGTVEDLMELELAYAPPFSSAKDPVNMAGFVASNVLAGRSHLITLDTFKEMKKEEYLLVDVRSEEEYNNGHLDGAINIPVDDLRGRLHELNINQTIVEYCQVGLRGYVADQILSGHGFKVFNLTGGYKTAVAVQYHPEYKEITNEMKTPKYVTIDQDTQTISMEAKSDLYDKKLDACGLCCPGPLMQVKASLTDMQNGQILKVEASDPGFYEDIKAWCKRTNNELCGLDKTGSNITAYIKKTDQTSLRADQQNFVESQVRDNKTMVVFSGDLDKAIASFIIANGAASMGKKVTMFFTFWGLTILRKPVKIKTAKDFMGTMFGMMLPRGSRKLKLSRMNMMGMGGKMIRGLMKSKNVSSLEELIQSAIDNGVEVVACQMSMDLMGFQKEELMDGVKIGGVGYYLGEAEDSNVNLFI